MQTRILIIVFSLFFMGCSNQQKFIYNVYHNEFNVDYNKKYTHRKYSDNIWVYFYFEKDSLNRNFKSVVKESLLTRFNTISFYDEVVYWRKVEKGKKINFSPPFNDTIETNLKQFIAEFDKYRGYN